MSHTDPAARVRLYANFGAEEQRDAKRASAELIRLLALWHGLFPPESELCLPSETFPPDTRREPDPPNARADLEVPLVQDWLRGVRGQVAWLPTAESVSAADRAGLEAYGPDPETVRRVHDKAFTVRSTSAITRTSWSMLCSVLEAAEPGAADPTDTAALVGKTVAGWPGKWRSRFVLKPRLGTSGRGRVPGRDGHLDEAGRRGLERLLGRGGAILEPWFDRIDDLSAQYWIESGGRLELLGTTCQIVGENGIYLGNEGVFEFDESERLHVRSGHWAEPRLIHDTIRLVELAAREGFSGPCGIDAFTYRDEVNGEERQVLRSLVEMNARFTVGTIALGWLERILALRLKGGKPMERGRWRFVFSPPLVRKLLGPDRIPEPNDGWHCTEIGPARDPAILALMPTD